MSWRLLRCLRPHGLLKISLGRTHPARLVRAPWHAARFGRRGAGHAAKAYAASPEMVKVEEQLTAIAQNIKFVDPIANLPREPTDEELSALQERLGHTFANRWLLRLALIHSSAAPETENSSLAWLGDAAMGLVATEQLLAGLGVGAPLGRLAQERERLVSRSACVQRARRLGLEHLIVVGQCLPRAEISRNMLAELFEAMVGAVFVDGGLPAVRTVYMNMLEDDGAEKVEE